jgi:C1A family cysteine protease
MTTTVKRGYGWKPDLPDIRDYQYAAPHDVLKAIPPVTDLRPNCGPIRDQGPLGSCTGFAATNAFWFDLLKQQLQSFEPSALFVYYNERVMQHTVQSDSGASIRESIKTLVQQGVCSTSDWPYNVNQFAVQPSQQAYMDAQKNKATLYQRVPLNLNVMRACIASGYGFAAGITVYSSFESAQVASTGIVPIPGTGESVLGGHAIFICGYDDTKQVFYAENSWGTSWGMQGFFSIPYGYLANPQLASDFWTLRAVS